ncbi:calmodulin-lysine N-methyltransferase-like [Dreissena polymorpha]|uniref:Calmodulin-lysine N-methyltransferase n=1 Tax=Dreissena polymorpha TaxID=45954 RepID=A0A9D4R840_DREPO|nr:calmodulin-lysine N-methyltransferase-like [Dreissena polymorpha]KAH3857267.1 hypothetical protein DPMN_099873 [Dreissena polymorpha]
MNGPTDSSGSGGSLQSRRIALKRWNILREVLLNGKFNHISNDTVSVRRFKSFGLLLTEKLPNKGEIISEGQWFIYRSDKWPEFYMHIRHLSDHVSPASLCGFNNTGNVCVWPSEEVLTYYCLQHLDMFKEASVIELGGGMTCLAGVALGIQSNAVHVELTDGNEASVANLEMIIKRNSPRCKASLTTRVLRWGSEPLDPSLVGKFDIVLCADCLFFGEGRSDLVKTIDELLKPEGRAILLAPKRGNSFDQFAHLAQSMFQVDIEQQYDDAVWGMHLKMTEKGIEHYDADIHYPWLMKLIKLPGTRESSSER